MTLHLRRTPNRGAPLSPGTTDVQHYIVQGLHRKRGRRLPSLPTLRPPYKIPVRTCVQCVLRGRLRSLPPCHVRRTRVLSWVVPLDSTGTVWSTELRVDSFEKEECPQRTRSGGVGEVGEGEDGDRRREVPSEASTDREREGDKGTKGRNI